MIWRLHQHRMAKLMLVLMVLATAIPVMSRAMVHARRGADAAVWVELCGSGGTHWIRLDALGLPGPTDVAISVPGATDGTNSGGATQESSSSPSSDWLDACPMCTLPMDRTVPMAAGWGESSPLLTPGPVDFTRSLRVAALPDHSRARGPPLVTV